MHQANQKHLTLEDRNYIEQALNQNMTFKEIAKFLSKDPTTISKEVKKHRIRKEPSGFTGTNICIKRYFCTKKNICGKNCHTPCHGCRNCSNHCPEFIEEICAVIQKAPFVCNSCNRKNCCKLVKYYYRALPSYNQYKNTLSVSRQGINLSDDELSELDNIVSPLLKQGQTIAHIYQTQDLKCSKSSLYNYIDQNKLDNPDAQVVEMDTVEGKKGGKVLLTMLFRNSKLMLAFLLEDKTSNSVLKVFNWLEAILGNELFEKTFPVILTDNGSEFSNPLSLEFNDEGIGRTRIFFCNPGASYQKGAIEKNHEFIRYIIPKGTSMDNLTQSIVTKIINHINSLTRCSLNNASPYDLAQILLDKDVLKKLNLKKVAANEIQLNKSLLKKN